MRKKKIQLPSDKIERIGNVVVKFIRKDREDAPIYCDGSEEKQLYMNLKKDPDYEKNIKDNKFSSWVEEYHLSPIRHNLLKWYPFGPRDTVLEVGAGCGALTGILCQKSGKVTALEYSRQRAMITAMRHHQYSNLEVIVGGLQDLASEQKFDCITVIGVLEYAGKFYTGQNPYESFLTKLHSMLNPKGTLIIAIENKIGLKYLCGAKEDHTERIFDSIYNYPFTNDVRTFSKKELSDILQTAGFSSLQWYYPLPDYKLPQQIISEEITPTDWDSIWRLLTVEHRHKKFLSEKRLGKTLTSAGLFGEFANSFLVIARTEDVPQQSKCVRFIGANMERKNKFRTNKKIYLNARTKQFIMSPDNDEGIEFLHEITRRETLAKKYFGKEAEVVTARFNNNNLIYPYMPFPTINELLARAISDGDSEFGRPWIDNYIQFLFRLPASKCIPEEFMRELGISSTEIPKPVHCLNCGIVDCVPHNILIDESNNKYYIIDNEFTYDFPIPTDFLIWRAISTLVFDLQEHIQSHVCRERPVVIFSGHGINRHYIPISWLDILKKLEIPLRQQTRWSSAFQNKILRHKTKICLRLKTKNKALGYVPIAEIDINHTLIERVYKFLQKVRRIL